MFLFILIHSCDSSDSCFTRTSSGKKATKNNSNCLQLQLQLKTIPPCQCSRGRGWWFDKSWSSPGSPLPGAEICKNQRSDVYKFILHRRELYQNHWCSLLLSLSHFPSSCFLYVVFVSSTVSVHSTKPLLVGRQAILRHCLIGVGTLNSNDQPSLGWATLDLILARLCLTCDITWSHAITQYNIPEKNH